MSFAARSLLGMSLHPNILTPVFSLRNTSGAQGIRSATARLVSDGSSVGGAGNWLDSVLAGNGAQFWVKLTLGSSSSTNVSGSSVGSWLNLGTDAAWSFSNSASNAEGTGNATLSFAMDSSGASVVGSGSINWDVGFTGA